MKSTTKIVKGSFFYFNLLFILFILLLAFSQNAPAQALPKNQSYSIAAPLPEVKYYNSAQIKIDMLRERKMHFAQQSERAVIDHKSFNVEEGYSVTHSNPDMQKNYITLHRVMEGSKSVIKDSISSPSNHHVWISNPSGLLITSSGRINVGNFFATTASLNHEQLSRFNKGDKTIFSEHQNDGSIINQGDIRITGKRGYAILAAPHVRNEGLIQANLGRVELAAGSLYAVDLDSDGLINFEVAGKLKKALIEQTEGGKLQADGGRILVTARAERGMKDHIINLDGVLQANTIKRDRGVIFIDGDIQSEGAVRISAKVLARGEHEGEYGGQVSIIGREVELERATLDARGFSRAHNSQIFIATPDKEHALHMYETNITGYFGKISANGDGWLQFFKEKEEQNKSFAGWFSDTGLIPLLTASSFLNPVTDSIYEGNGEQIGRLGVAVVLEMLDRTVVKDMTGVRMYPLGDSYYKRTFKTIWRSMLKESFFLTGAVFEAVRGAGDVRPVIKGLRFAGVMLAGGMLANDAYNYFADDSMPETETLVRDVITKRMEISRKRVEELERDIYLPTLLPDYKNTRQQGTISYNEYGFEGRGGYLKDVVFRSA